ncbi:MAG: hypothetical protein EXR50_04525 [Dehalococcoidia bacterium]|nr:hypothetical protein [Dehalococcoidia bacterium]
MFFSGSPGLLNTQIITLAVTWVYAGAVTFIPRKIVHAAVGLRVEAEALGRDSSQRGELAYRL